MTGINTRWLKMASPTRKIFYKFSHKVTDRSPLRVHRQFFKRNVIGFCYHVVSDELLPHIPHLYPQKSTFEFEQDLLYLKRHFRLVSYQDLTDYFLGIRRLPSNAAYISFDDGFAECYTADRPLLLKHRIPCIFFLTTDFIDNRHLCYRSKVSLCVDKPVPVIPPDKNLACWLHQAYQQGWAVRVMGKTSRSPSGSLP